MIMTLTFRLNGHRIKVFPFNVVNCSSATESSFNQTMSDNDFVDDEPVSAPPGARPAT
jgi:hypothetical protein